MSTALFVNDTGAEKNPGCRAVSATIRRMLDERGYSIGSIPLGYWAADFKALDTIRRKAFASEGTTLPHWVPEVAPIDVEDWNALRVRLRDSDPLLDEQLARSSIVVINGEGSIHHNFPRGLAVLAIALCAAEKGIPVHLVNSTIQAMSPELLKFVLPRLSLIHVREPQSFAEIQPLVADRLRLSIDLAFGAAFHPVDEALRRSEHRCLLTSGVGVHPRYLSMQIEAIRKIGFEPVYLLIGDGGEAQVTAEVCGEHNVEIVSSGDLEWQELPNYVSRFPFAVSGRHHINIFLMRAGVPFIPLPSNTWKIEETLRFAGYPLMPVATIEALGEALRQLTENLDEFASASQAAGARGVSLVRDIL